MSPISSLENPIIMAKSFGHADRQTMLLTEGLQLHRQGKLDAALEHYREILKMQPRHFAAAHFSGVVYLQKRQLDDARRLLEIALAVNPNDANVLSDYGTALAMSGEARQALAAYDRALASDSRHAGACLNRANVLISLKRYADALEALDTAAALDPSNPQVPNSRGLALSKLGRFDEALVSYALALARGPDYADALLNRGNTLLTMRRDDEALASYQAVLRLRPSDVEARYGVGFVRLRSGDLAAGFRDYESRWHRSELAPFRRDLGRPIWLGEGPVNGKTVLLHAEQGLGDTIQFARYAQLVAERGARIVLEIQTELKPLFEGMAETTVIGRGDRLPPFDLHCPLLSLPLACGTTLATVPAGIPYLKAAPVLVESWRNRLAGPDHLKVGIVWSGNPKHRNDQNRSIELRRFADILTTPGVAFYTLNPSIDPGDVEFLTNHTQVAHIAGQFRDFSDTAAVIAQLDLVISVDTAVAHLTGAMGKEVWLMLPYEPDWRWMTDRDDSPWYTTAKLFRQPRIGAWDAVFVTVAERFAAWIQSKSNRTTA
jgi:tetratricopeptide (TPR) repeat protein